MFSSLWRKNFKMSSLLQSTRNTRALPTGTMKYIRSDVPENLTDNEIRWLLDNNFGSVSFVNPKNPS